MQSRQAVPVVPVAVRPALLQPTNKASQKALPVPPPGPPGLQGSIDLLSCGTRLPCSLVDAVLSPSALFCVHRAHSRAWSTTPITPPNIGQSRHPVLPTSNFSLLLAVTVSVIVTATACCCCCARCLLVLQVSRAAKTATLDRHLPAQQPQTWMSLPFPTLISTVRLSAACPPPLFSQPTSVYQTRARLKKNTKESDVPTLRRSTH